jgi:hypothetical protein
MEEKNKKLGDRSIISMIFQEIKPIHSEYIHVIRESCKLIISQMCCSDEAS